MPLLSKASNVVQENYLYGVIILAILKIVSYEFLLKIEIAPI